MILTKIKRFFRRWCSEENNKILVKLVHPNAKIPIKTHPNEDAGFDLFSVDTKKIKPFTKEEFSVGIALGIPLGYYGQIATRSSYGNRGLRVHPGVIDAGYRGEITILVFNMTKKVTTINKGDKIAQLLILPAPNFEIVEETQLPPSSRGSKGFGSSGK